MRIIAGKFKGHKLKEFTGPHIRPTTDRVKETLFNIFNTAVADSRILDLCAGTGNLGLEALSRGAAFVTFVDNNKHSVRLIKNNIDEFKVTTQAEVILADSFDFLSNYCGIPYEVILIDPPFTEKMADKIMTTLVHSKVVSSHSLIAIESSRWEVMHAEYGQFSRFKFRQFGDKYLSCFRVEE